MSVRALRFAAAEDARLTWARPGEYFGLEERLHTSLAAAGGAKTSQRTPNSVAPGTRVKPDRQPVRTHRSQPLSVQSEGPVRASVPRGPVTQCTVAAQHPTPDQSLCDTAQFHPAVDQGYCRPCPRSRVSHASLDFSAQIATITTNTDHIKFHINTLTWIGSSLSYFGR